VTSAPSSARPGSPPRTALTVFLVVLIAVPSRLVVGPLGGAGTPAEIIGVVLFAGWLFGRLSGRYRSRVAQPVQVAVLVFGASVLASYIAAATRPIAANELRAADLGLLSTVAWLGIMFMTVDGPPTLRDLDTLLRRLTYLGAAIASLGLLQFATGQPFTNYIQIPGLSVNNDLISVLDRGGLVRPAGTALHPIEFGAVLTMILPLALYYAFNDSHRGRVARWFPVATIAFAVPISISRSAIVSAAVVLCIMIPSWAARTRRRAYVTLVGLFASVYIMVPGLLGTITGLFTNISGDSSAASRTGSYSLAWEFIARSPIFGRGFRTFLPSYRILDNQYLGTTIEMGFIGVLALLGLFITAAVNAQKIKRRSLDPQVRGLAQALTASAVGAGCSFALFDAFAFPMAAGLLFFLLGGIGALGRLADGKTVAEPAVQVRRERVPALSGASS
jgi:O-antigen ligase